MAKTNTHSTVPTEKEWTFIKKFLWADSNVRFKPLLGIEGTEFPSGLCLPYSNVLYGDL